MHKKTQSDELPDEFIQGTHYRILLNDKNNEAGENEELVHKELVHEGVFVSETEDFIYLKLSSGYNIGIAKKKIKSAENSEKDSGKKADFGKKIKKEIEEDTEESKSAKLDKDTEILILHTGGTIASKVDYSTGAVNAKFTPEEMVELFPELRNIAKIDSKLIRNMWSDDIRLDHYNILAKEIEKALKINSLKGIILTHGTDTLHYTASALSFIFESLPVPVMLVGSQRSSDRPSSDAALNLLSAALFISKAHDHELNGVFICMHESNDDKNCLVLPAQNIKKLHSSRRDAFQCVNCSPVARVNFERRDVERLAAKKTNTAAHTAAEESLQEHLQGHSQEHAHKKTPDAHSHVAAKLFNPEIKVGLIKSRPGFLPEELKIYEKFDGLILEGTGLGHFPIEQIDEETEPNKEIFEELKKLASKKVVCMTTQTVFGRVNLNVYSPGRMLKEAGILGHNLDMISETAYIKLAWLLSNYSAEEARKLYSENLRGEISERSEKEEFL